MTWLQAGEGPMLTPDPAVMRAWRADPRPFHAVVLLLGPDQLREIDRPMGADPLRRRIDAVTAALGGLVEPITTPHVTLHVTGSARPALAPEPVAVAVGGADSFASAAFLHVSGERLRTLRSEIESRLGAEVDGARPWVPHVTVGTYRRPATAELVAERLAGLRHQPPLRITGRLAVVTVDRRHGGLHEVDEPT